MDIDEIFKVSSTLSLLYIENCGLIYPAAPSMQRPPLPKTSSSTNNSNSNSNKRKLPSEPSFDPESYKSIKLSTDQSPSSSGVGGGGVTIQDEREGEEDGQGDEFAPNGDADYFEEEDEDGRFL